MNATVQMFFRNDLVRIRSGNGQIGRVVDVTGDWISVRWPNEPRPITIPRTSAEAA